ncbi:MAG: hypothetical protein J7M26_07360, partial [Armatimonadetes bacterium]|nr:hypothetical protein [Armatimonadota bacterium]
MNDGGGAARGPARRAAGTFAVRRLVLVVICAAVCAAALAWLTPYSDYYVGATYVANHHVPIVASVLLALVAGLVNPLLGRLRAGWRLSRAELAAFWIVLAVPSGIPSSGLMRFLIPVLPALRYYATPENRFEELLWPHLLSWLVPTDERAIVAFYDGASGPMLPYWRAWLLPALTWSLIALLAWWVMFTLASLLRRQWCDHERMSFPHVQLPLEIVGNPAAATPFFSSRLMWIGFLLPVVLYGLVGLHEFFPAVPKPRFLWPNYYAAAIRFRSHPFNAIQPLLPAFFPSIIAFGYLVTAEVSFSVWAGYFLLCAETVLLAAFGTGMRMVSSGMGRLQFAAFQDMGAYVVLVGVLLWVARRHLGALLEDALAPLLAPSRAPSRSTTVPSQALERSGRPPSAPSFRPCAPRHQRLPTTSPEALSPATLFLTG